MIQQYNLESDFEKFLNYQLIYNIAYLIVQLGWSQEYYVIFALLGVVLFIRFIFDIKYETRLMSNGISVIFILYSLYSIYVISNFNGDYGVSSILRYAYLPSGMLFFIAPIVLLRYADISLFNTICAFIYRQTKFCMILLVIGLLYNSLLGIPEDRIVIHFECLQLYIGGGLVFLLLFLHKLCKKQRVFILISVLLMMLLSSFLARRSIVATYIIGFFFYFIGNTLSSTSLTKKIILISIYSAFLGLSIFIIVEYGDVLFEKLFGRLGDDTRSGVELEVMYILERSDKFFTGMGINSYYYSDYVGEYRDGCETGYLNMMMKGGYIFLILYYLLCLPALLKLLFMKNKNRDIWMTLFYFVLVIIVGNAASSTFTFSIRYIVFIYLILCMYNKNNKTKLYTHEF